MENGKPRIESIVIKRMMEDVMTRNELKTYGVRKLHNGRFAVVSDITERNGHLFFHTRQDLNYKKYDFAIKKAESFTKSCYENFVDFQKNQVIFTFKNMGLIS